MTTTRKPRGAVLWTVERHGGKVHDWWRLIFSGSESGARERFEQIRVSLRQGGVRLREPGGEINSSAYATTPLELGRAAQFPGG